MRKFLQQLFLSKRFFLLAGLLVFGFILAFVFPGLFGIFRWFAALLLFLLLLDIILLFITGKSIQASRELPERFSNGDQNPVPVLLRSRYAFTIDYDIIEELPEQFQARDFSYSGKLKAGESREIIYSLRPTERGIYTFGRLIVLVSSPLGLIQRRFSYQKEESVAVYPSFLELRKYELLALSNRLSEYGLKKIRRIGHTMEFEHIREYVSGDDVRNLNWKATAKKAELMVNQYQDEKSQPVYSVIDTGRVMQMPFNGLALLDYAINATLVLSRVALRKQDKAGMMTFNCKVDNRVVANRRSSQMQRILETLYHIRTDYAESDFARLYTDIKRSLPFRSLLLLYTNFETLDALNRQLSYLKALSRDHLLVVIFFRNTELENFSSQETDTVRGIYHQTIARKFIFERKRIVRELGRHGIQSLLTRPEDLTVATLNKYLEIKARGLF